MPAVGSLSWVPWNRAGASFSMEPPPSPRQAQGRACEAAPRARVEAPERHQRAAAWQRRPKRPRQLGPCDGLRRSKTYPSLIWNRPEKCFFFEEIALDSGYTFGFLMAQEKCEQAWDTPCGHNPVGSDRDHSVLQCFLCQKDQARVFLPSALICHLAV